jgi:hypothetical protein
MTKNWPNDLKTICKSTSNVMELNEKDFDFENELEKFEGSFERDELVHINFNISNFMFFTFLNNLISFKIK